MPTKISVLASAVAIGCELPLVPRMVALAGISPPFKWATVVAKLPAVFVMSPVWAGSEAAVRVVKP